MINVKVIMNSGIEYNIKNNTSGNIMDFIRNVLAPMGTQMRWAEILPGVMIQTENIDVIRVLSDEEIELINAPVIIEDQPIISGDEVIVPIEQGNEEIGELE